MKDLIIHRLILVFVLLWVPSAKAQLQLGPSSLYTFSSLYNYGDEFFADVFRDSDGAAYVVGGSNGPFDINDTSTRDRLIIQKYSSAGTPLWKTVWLDPAFDYSPRQILELDSQSLLVRYRRSDNNNTYLAKLSKATGETLWTKVFTYSYNEQGTGFVAKGIGRFFRMVEGSGSDSLTTVECYDQNGSLLWSRAVQFEAVGYFSRYSGGYASHALANESIWYDFPVCDIAPNGDLLLGGITQFSQALNLPSFVRIDASGTELHPVVKLPNVSAARVFSVTGDSDGNAYVLNFIGGDKLALTKISRGGVQLWQKQLPNFSQYYYVRPLFIGELLVLIQHGSNSFALGVYSKEGDLLQSWNFLHDVGTTYGYNVNSQGFLASVGSKSYTASAVDATLRLARIQEVPVRQISLSGDLSFGAVNVGSVAQRTMIISNTGNSALNVSSINLPAGFTASWTAGTIAANGTQSVTVFFSPTAGQNYGGNISVNSDATGGTYAIACSGSGLAQTPVITSSLVANGQVGSFFSYQITAISTPSSYGASGLPPGLSVNSSTGLISGTPSSAGTYNVTLFAANNGGTGSASLTLTVTATPAPSPTPTPTPGPTPTPTPPPSFGTKLQKIKFKLPKRLIAGKYYKLNAGLLRSCPSRIPSTTGTWLKLFGTENFIFSGCLATEKSPLRRDKTATPCGPPLLRPK